MRISKKIKIVVLSVVLLIFLILSYVFFNILTDDRAFSVDDKYSNDVHISDNYDNNFDEIRNTDNITEKLYTLNSAFHNAKSFDYLEVSFKQIFVRNYEKYTKFSENFSSNLSDDGSIKLKSLFLDDNAYNFYGLELIDGNGFEKKSYDYDNNDLVPVVLGNSYKDFFKSGDILDFTVNTYEKKAVVIGLLKENTKIARFNEMVSLDDVVILPFDMSNFKDSEYNFMLILDRNNGVIVPKIDFSIDSMREEFENITHSMNLSYSTSYSFYEHKQLEFRHMIVFISTLTCSVVLIVVLILVIKKKQIK